LPVSVVRQSWAGGSLSLGLDLDDFAMEVNDLHPFRFVNEQFFTAFSLIDVRPAAKLADAS
jgi:hypothetical protein